MCLWAAVMRRELARSLIGKRVIVTVPHMICALTDRRIGRGIARLITLAHGTATGKTKDQRCFVCRRRRPRRARLVGPAVPD
jgi:hypothetical protein